MNAKNSKNETSNRSVEAWDAGYYYAVRGILHMPCGTWVSQYSADFQSGYKAAIHDGNWGTFNG